MNYLPMTKIYTTDQIVSELKEILDIKYDNDLAEYLGTSKQSIYQYKKKVNSDIQQKIISELLIIIKNRDVYRDV